MSIESRLPPRRTHGPDPGPSNSNVGKATESFRKSDTPPVLPDDIECDVFKRLSGTVPRSRGNAQPCAEGKRTKPGQGQNAVNEVC